MKIQTRPHQEFYPVSPRSTPRHPGRVDAPTWTALVRSSRQRACHRALLQAWAVFLGRPEVRLAGVHELRPGQGLGPAAVDGAGGVSVACRARSGSVGFVAVSGSCGAAVGAAFSQGISGGLRIADGNLHLPDGTSIPFGNRGVIVRLPDGAQVAVGRNGDGPQARQCRWVVAGPGEQIPTSPPGATQVYGWDGAGGLRDLGSV
jgi:hypothetical protein